MVAVKQTGTDKNTNRTHILIQGDVLTKKRNRKNSREALKKELGTLSIVHTEWRMGDQTISLLSTDFQ